MSRYRLRGRENNYLDSDETSPAPPSRRRTKKAPPKKRRKRNPVPRPVPLPVEFSSDSDPDLSVTDHEKITNTITSRLNTFMKKLHSDTDSPCSLKPSTSQGSQETSPRPVHYALSESDSDHGEGSRKSQTLSDTKPSIALTGSSNEDFNIKEVSPPRPTVLNDSVGLTSLQADPVNLFSLDTEIDAYCLTANSEVPDEVKKIKTPVKKGPMCPVCLEFLGGDLKAATTVCGHMFCKPCINAVLRTSKKCPSCRKGLSKKKVINVFL